MLSANKRNANGLLSAAHQAVDCHQCFTPPNNSWQIGRSGSQVATQRRYIGAY